MTYKSVLTLSTAKPMLSKDDTTALKGLALLMLLIHHLFYIQNGRFDDIAIYGNISLVNMTGQICKVCVALFVFLSGYGLAATYPAHCKIKFIEFFKKRFKKLYINYWLIWILFVPIGIIFAGRTFEQVYGHDIPIKFILDVMGIINLTGEYGYNPTWWFYSCITILYLLFPLITLGSQHRLLRFLMFLISIALVILPFHITFIEPIRYYLIAFLAGYFMYIIDLQDITPPHSDHPKTQLKHIFQRGVNGKLSKTEKIVLLSVLFFLMAVRFKLPYALGFDTLIALLIVLAYRNITPPTSITRFLGLCGKHSFNIFLFHTFLYYLYIPDIIYWSRNPIIIFITLLVFCLPISYLINRIRGILRFNIYNLYKQKAI